MSDFDGDAYRDGEGLCGGYDHVVVEKKKPYVPSIPTFKQILKEYRNGSGSEYSGSGERYQASRSSLESIQIAEHITGDLGIQAIPQLKKSFFRFFGIGSETSESNAERPTNEQIADFSTSEGEGLSG